MAFNTDFNKENGLADDLLSELLEVQRRVVKTIEKMSIFLFYVKILRIAIRRKNAVVAK